MQAGLRLFEIDMGDFLWNYITDIWIEQAD